MMQYEFEALAGYSVSTEDYIKIIEPMYMATNLDKAEFVKCLDKKRFAINAGTKFEIIRDDDGEVRGYKLGHHYLLKHYTWGNNYEWIINTTGKFFYYNWEFENAWRNGEIELVNSCKAGKEKLIKLENHKED